MQTSSSANRTCSEFSSASEYTATVLMPSSPSASAASAAAAFDPAPARDAAAGPGAAATAGADGGNAGIAATGLFAASFLILSLRPSCSISNSERSCARTRSRICFSWSRSMKSSQCHELRRGVGEHVDAALGHEHIVFDAHAAEAWQIRARFDGEHHAGGDGRVAALVGPAAADARIFVHLDAEAVAGAVPERVAEAAAFERAPGGGVDVEPRPSGRDRLDRAIVRFPNGR